MFVEELRISADAAETGEAPIFEEGSEGIRMMSVHKAKGLEFPVVNRAIRRITGTCADYLYGP